LPIEIARFGEDYRISSVVAGLENALGGRVLKVHETPISRAAELILPLAARDENPPLAQAFVEDALTTGATLHGLGITPDRNAARYTLADDAGREFSVEVQAVPPGDQGYADPAIQAAAPIPRESGIAILVQYLPEARTLYCNVRAMQNLYALRQRRCWALWRSTIRTSW
jgi:hypothetical protein